MIVSTSSDYQIISYNYINNIPSNLNVFIGMTAILTSPIVSNSSGILRSGVPLTSSKFTAFFSVKGLLIQSSSIIDILFSPKLLPKQTTIQCISPKRCASYDGFMRYTTNRKVLFLSECVICGQGQVYDIDKDGCLCRQGYLNINGTCVKPDCLVTEVWDNQTISCVCLSGYIK